MAATLDPRDTGSRVLALLEGAEKAVIVAPFITVSGLKPLLAALDRNANVTIFTRWRPEEVAAGASDPGIYDLMTAREGPCVIRLHHLLHAKLYLRPGDALVGSANATVTGLGWGKNGGLELLVGSAEKDPAITALLTLLETVCPVATLETRDQVLEQAEHFRQAQVPQELKADTGRDLSGWLPAFSAPRALWQVYAGNRTEMVTRLAEPDLAVLSLPDGLSEEQFNAYIRSVLLQSLPGHLAQQLRNRSTYQAIQHLQGVAEALGVEVNDPESAWKTLTAWLAYFFPDRYTLGPGGPTLYN